MGNKRLNLIGDIQFPEGNVNGTMFFECGFGLRNNPHKGVMTKISPLLHTSTISHYNDYRCIQFSVLLVMVELVLQQARYSELFMLLLAMKHVHNNDASIVGELYEYNCNVPLRF